MARIPAVGWLRGYRRGFVLRDLAGGLAVGSMLIPQGLAFAQIVRVPPVAGLWSGVAAMIGYALFGPSRHLIVGPEAGTAMMVAAVLTSAAFDSPVQRLGAAALVAIMVGAVLVVAGLFRLGATGVTLSALLDFEARGIHVLGHIERGLPALGLSALPARSIPVLAPGALSVALLQSIGRENVFSTVGEAIHAYVDRAETALGRDVDWRRVDDPPRPSGGAP